MANNNAPGQGGSNGEIELRACPTLFNERYAVSRQHDRAFETVAKNPDLAKSASWNAAETVWAQWIRRQVNSLSGPGHGTLFTPRAAASSAILEGALPIMARRMKNLRIDAQPVFTSPLGTWGLAHLPLASDAQTTGAKA